MWRNGVHSSSFILDSGRTLSTGCFAHGEIAPGTHRIGGWANPRAVLDTVDKIFSGWSRMKAETTFYILLLDAT
jgi:hypothetical protein